MKKAYETGNIKRKRKASEDEQIKLLPKVDKITQNLPEAVSEQIEFTADDNHN